MTVQHDWFFSLSSNLVFNTYIVARLIPICALQGPFCSQHDLFYTRGSNPRPLVKGGGIPTISPQLSQHYLLACATSVKFYHLHMTSLIHLIGLLANA